MQQPQNVFVKKYIDFINVASKDKEKKKSMLGGIEEVEEVV